VGGFFICYHQTLDSAKIQRRKNMENFNVLNDTQETVVESQETEAEATSEVTETEEVETAEVVETAKPQQTAEENAKFAEIRRKYEAELRREQAEKDLLLKAVGQYGYEGSAQEIYDKLTAQTQGISQEEAKAQREAIEAENAKYSKLQSEVETYKSLAIEKLKSDDLAKLKSAYPENKEVQKLKSIDELGGEFFSLLSATHDPELAYDALQAKNARHTKPIPPDIGAVNSSSGKEKDFYTPAEVDKLTDKDYDNPKIMEIVRKSMLKW
jgi:hypothetical protein